MFRRFGILTLTLTMLVGCKFTKDAARVQFTNALLVSPDSSAFSGTSDLSLTDPNHSSFPSWEGFETGPLEDFNFSDASSYKRLSLDECIRVALSKSPVIRELGGLILRAPDSVGSANDPSLAYVDPRFGEEAALSNFDANWSSQILFQKNDGIFNNLFIGDEGTFQQDLAKYRNGVSKLAATGGEFQFNHVVDYELNNSPSNRFNGNRFESFSYNTFLEAGFRQPLLQGSGSQFNRIAGPNNQPGVYNGVLIARANTDIALADFQIRVRDLISDVENAYWDLYFAYRDLEAKVEARNGAYDIWRNVEANKGEKSAAIIGQAKEQYYRFAAEVEDAIFGRLTDGTRTNNGSSSGTFRRSGGVRTAERRLRLITGMVLNDQQLVVPNDQPLDAASVFDWSQSRGNALSNRSELRRQKWRIRQRELELLASKNHLLPRVDVLGKYRVKGFGHDLFGDGNELNVDGSLEEQLDSSAFGTLTNGNLQEWELGIDMSMPLGFRQAHAAKRHAELRLARERAVLTEQERSIIFGLSNAMGELVRTSRVRKANLNRLDAANEQFEAIQNIWKEQDTTIDLVLEAQRRVIEAKLQYFQTQVEYMLAVKGVHFEEGTLFEYHNVTLAESNASREAQQSSTRRASSLRQSINYWIPGLNISRGPASQSSSQTVSANANGGTSTTPAINAFEIQQDWITPAGTEWSSISDHDATAIPWETPTSDVQLNSPDVPSTWEAPIVPEVENTPSDRLADPFFDPFADSPLSGKIQKSNTNPTQLTSDQPIPSQAIKRVLLSEEKPRAAVATVPENNDSPVRTANLNQDTVGVSVSLTPATLLQPIQATDRSDESNKAPVQLQISDQ
jgi:outer membrane protein TolC